MKIKSMHPDFKMPERKTDGSGGYDLFMPQAGSYKVDWGTGEVSQFGLNLGFAMQVPAGYVALLLPRSVIGIKKLLELNNTVGVIDSDYRGEVQARLRTKDNMPFRWEAGDRLLQMLIVPVLTPELELVDELDETKSIITIATKCQF